MHWWKFSWIKYAAHFFKNRLKRLPFILFPLLWVEFRTKVVLDSIGRLPPRLHGWLVKCLQNPRDICQKSLWAQASSLWFIFYFDPCLHVNPSNSWLKILIKKSWCCKQIWIKFLKFWQICCNKLMNLIF